MMLAAFGLFLLATPSFASSDPAWDPSRPSLWFSRLTEGHWQIWSLDLETGAERQMTQTPGDKRFPNLTPDSSALLFLDAGGALNRLDRADGRTTRVLESQTPLSEPAISPDGKLAYMRVRREGSYQTDVWTCDLLGRDLRKLTQPPLRQMEPAWSQDGRKLAFVQFDPREKFYALVAANPDGSAQETLYRGKDRLASPAWLAGGAHLVFAREIEGNHDLWIFERASAQWRQLTFHPDLDYSPVCSGDGDWIYFVSRRSGSLELWKIPPAGGNPKPVTTSGKPCRDPFYYTPRNSATLCLRAAVQKDEVSFSLNEKARVRVELLDLAGRKIAASEEKEFAPGEHKLSCGKWLGPDAKLPGGVGFVKLRAWSESGAASWDPRNETGGETVRISDLRFDKERKKIHFTLPSRARVRVRAGIEQGPMLATIWDWAARESGAVEIPFPGDLPDPWGDFWERPDAKVLIWACALPENALLTEFASEVETLGEEASAPYFGVGRDLDPHARHAPQLCRDPKIRVSLDGEFPRDGQGLPIVSGRLSLRIDAENERDRAISENVRFEVMLYMDGQFLLEDEDSLLPFHYPLDVSRFSEGVHTVLVNLVNFQDHAGRAFLSFRIAKGGR